MMDFSSAQNMPHYWDNVLILIRTVIVVGLMAGYEFHIGK